MHQSGSLSDSKNSLHFVTGATSLFGAEYIYTVLTNSATARCALLIHTKKSALAEIRVNDLLHYLFGSGDTYKKMRARIDIYCGDVTQRRLGLNEDSWEVLRKSADYIFHAASNSNLSDNRHALDLVNVMGTAGIISFAKKCTQLIRILHVSTAYVAGKQSGLIVPSEVDIKQPVSDNYQLSKRVGEKLMRKHTEHLPIVILRPSTLVGHSVLGRTNSYKAFYYPTRMLTLGHRVVFPASRTGKIEAVPVDWAARIAYKLLFTPNIEGRCFHLTMGDRAYSMPQVKRIVLKCLDKYGTRYKPVYVIPKTLYSLLIAPLVSILHPSGRNLNRDFRVLSHYTCIDRIFDNSDTFRATGEDRHQLPGLEGYYHKLCKYAIENRWNKIKSPSSMNRTNYMS